MEPFWGSDPCNPALSSLGQDTVFIFLRPHRFAGAELTATYLGLLAHFERLKCVLVEQLMISL